LSNHLYEIISVALAAVIVIIVIMFISYKIKKCCCRRRRSQPAFTNGDSPNSEDPILPSVAFHRGRGASSSGAGGTTQAAAAQAFGQLPTRNTSSESVHTRTSMMNALFGGDDDDHVAILPVSQSQTSGITDYAGSPNHLINV